MLVLIIDTYKGAVYINKEDVKEITSFQQLCRINQMATSKEVIDTKPFYKTFYNIKMKTKKTIYPKYGEPFKIEIKYTTHSIEGLIDKKSE